MSVAARPPRRCLSPANRITWVHPPGGFFGLSLLNGLLRILTLGVYHFWGKTEVRQRIWSAVRVDGEPLEYRGTGGELFRGFLIVFVLVLLPLGIITFVVPLLLGPRLAGRGVFEIAALAPRLHAVGGRHPPRAPLPALAHPLARHPRRPFGTLGAVRLDLSVDHPAHAPHARLDPAVARRAAAAGALQRHALRRQGLHLHRPRRSPLQALLAGVGERASCCSSPPPAAHRRRDRPRAGQRGAA